MAIAQLVESKLVELVVAGSNPVGHPTPLFQRLAAAGSCVATESHHIAWSMGKPLSFAKCDDCVTNGLQFRDNVAD